MPCHCGSGSEEKGTSQPPHQVAARGHFRLVRWLGRAFLLKAGSFGFDFREALPSSLRSHCQWPARPGPAGPLPAGASRVCRLGTRHRDEPRAGPCHWQWQ